jgi:hypothetical protein
MSQAQRRCTEVAAEYETLAAIGLDPEAIAEEIGIKPRGLYQALARARKHGVITTVCARPPDKDTERAPRLPLPTQAELRRWYRRGCPLK